MLQQIRKEQERKEQERAPQPLGHSLMEVGMGPGTMMMSVPSPGRVAAAVAISGQQQAQQPATKKKHGSSSSSSTLSWQQQLELHLNLPPNTLPIGITGKEFQHPESGISCNGGLFTLPSISNAWCWYLFIFLLFSLSQILTKLTSSEYFFVFLPHFLLQALQMGIITDFHTTGTDG